MRIGNRLVAFDVGVIGGHLTMESDSVDHEESISVQKGRRSPVAEEL